MTVDPSEHLSENFTLGELLQSDTAERDTSLKQQQYSPPAEVVDNLRYLVETTLQPIREQLGFPIQVTSGYRCPHLNKLVGGSATSQHCVGEAADCKLASRFLSDSASSTIRNEAISGYKNVTGSSFDFNPNPDFFLWLFCCLRLETLDVDQVIHEYGDAFGQPAWVHISASRRQNRRQIVVVGDYTDRKYLRAESLSAVLAMLKEGRGTIG